LLKAETESIFNAPPPKPKEDAPMADQSNPAEAKPDEPMKEANEEGKT
jgi:hypothetical protein